MVKQTGADQALIKMPSLRAVKAFLAAARYQNFTRAAEALCVTQAAISRHIRDLEVHLGTELFDRAGRAVKLTDAGSNFYDVVQLSFNSIAQAAERMRSNSVSKHVVTLCCSPAFTHFWLGPRLPAFFKAYPEIDLNLVVTQNFLSMETGVHPDIIICKMMKTHDGFHSQPLVCDVIYPVCTPLYLEQHPELQSIHGIRDSALLNLSPFGRSQVAEHLDWYGWFAHHDIDLKARSSTAPHFFNANDYNLLIQLALEHQGVALGWHYLVAPLIEKGLLVRPVKEKLVHRETLHYMNFNEDKARDPSCRKLRDWLSEQFDRGLLEDPDVAPT